MKKFIVLYQMSASEMESMPQKSPEEMKEGMKPWFEWKEKCGAGLVDMGSPLGNSKNVNKSGNTDSNSEVKGYSIIQADSMDKALEMLQNHPHYNYGKSCNIEIHECMPMPGK
jgi:hypothetical protein